MNILVMCESSGTVRDAFRKLGHNAWSCDLLEANPGTDATYHIQGDCFAAFDLLSEKMDIDLVIAHPPCTYLTISAAWAFTDGPYHQKVKPGTLVGAERRKAREDAIKFAEAIWNLPVPSVCIENPVGVLSTMSNLGKATQYIQPYDFGDDASKRTGLWLRGLAPLAPTKRFDGRIVEYNGKQVERWSNQTDSGQNALTPTDDRWKTRSKTYQGIADAMADQWGRQLRLAL